MNYCTICTRERPPRLTAYPTPLNIDGYACDECYEDLRKVEAMIGRDLPPLQSKNMRV